MAQASAASSPSLSEASLEAGLEGWHAERVAGTGM